MARISSHQKGITNQELAEAIPDSLLSKDLHLHWVDKTRSREGYSILTAKIEIDGQILLLHSRSDEAFLKEDWDVNDPNYHTNARLVALERILSDPANEDILLSI